MNAHASLRAGACLSLLGLSLALSACGSSDAAKTFADVKIPDIWNEPEIPNLPSDATPDQFSDGSTDDGTWLDTPSSDVNSCEFATDPQPGEPGTSCTVAADCNNGICVESANGKICTSTCSDCCPGGMRCEQLPGPDAIFACVPSNVNVCRPCMADSDCTAIGDDALCVSYGDGGRFCGSTCTTNADCPVGYGCKDATGTLGASKQCVLTTGECACSKKAIGQGAVTTCATVNGSGACPGQRKCLAAGLSACDGAIPADEICNGIDDNCNGTTDDAGAVGCTTYWLDSDQDGAGLSEVLGGKGQCLCKAVDLYTAASASDCNDQSKEIGPGIIEICNDLDDNCDGQTDEGCDDDGDGWCNANALIVGMPSVCAKGLGDCDDKVATTHPTALEQCNDADDNCNSLFDEGCDDDLDGYCDAKLSYVGQPTICPNGGLDCDDGDKTVHPGALETCNDYDDNCDGAKDEGCDDDLDGYCDGGMVLVGVPAVCAKGGGDCDDSVASIAPGVTETCDNADDNCNGKTDEGCDDDKDGYCDAAMGLTGSPAACPAGGGDCDDFSAAVSPSAVEACDSIDNNCDAKTDEGCDDDADGYCDAAMILVGWPAVCPKGGKDCDDAAVDVSPGANEVCANAKDDNCDGETDEGIGASGCTVFYLDGDGDKYGAAQSQCSCAPVGLFAAVTPGDCADYDAAINPGQIELCSNGKDDNCNGAIDEPSASGCVSFFVDADSDQYGTGAPACLCSPDATHTVKKSGDCDDANPKKNPSMPELCNGFDDDCDGVTDGADSVGCKKYYADNDGDGFGNAQDGVCLCAADAAHPVEVSGDCDDTNAKISGGGKEVCDGLDNNCDGQTDEPGATGCLSAFVDGDGDGFGEGTTAQCVCKVIANTVQIGGDCNDKNPSVHPGANEKCNTLDDDCNGQTDEENATGCTSWLFDGDGDGFGIDTKAKCFCDATLPYTTKTAGDCDDTNSATKPGGTELCDGKDNNCDSITDNMGAVGCTVYYSDKDADGFGTATPPAQCLCAAKVPFVATVLGDCDDTKEMTNPGASEYCDGEDNNCNGVTDDAGSIGCQAWYADADGDKYGLTSDSQCLCGAVGKYSTTQTKDCDDTKASVHPNAPELCNGLDDNCNGITDSDSPAATTYYYDGDNDGWGNSLMTAKLCFPQGFYKATFGTDCLDTNAAVYPNATEVCNGIDDDCDKQVDEANATGCMPYYLDLDGDGYGIATQQCQCKASGNYSAFVPGDCNDAVSTTNPGAPELCDGVDNNCDKVIDEENAKSCTTWFADADGDTFGNPEKGKCLCASVGIYTVGNSLDCNDSVNSVHPGATEVCANNIDDNCNGMVDEQNSTGCTTYLYDADGDTFGLTGTGKCLCGPNPLTHFTAIIGGDCNDAQNPIHPGATEICNKADDNCNGETDEADSVGCLPWYLDSDKDGYGSMTTPTSCLCKASGDNTTTTGGDCNDNAPLVHPMAYEMCNGVDDNCNAIVDDDSPDNKNWYFDGDGDGYGTAAAKKSCFPTGEFTATQLGDCDDTNAGVFPGAAEVCNSIDDNCNGVTDDDSPDAKTWYFDADSDTYGSSASIVKCLASGKYTATNGDDCDDNKNNAHPGAVEVCNGYDDNCDSKTDEEDATGCKYFSLDADGDTYGVTGSIKCLCASGVGAPLYTATQTGDCDDGKNTVNPGVTEQCADNIDNNCDGVTDNVGAACVTFYPDADKDGYGAMNQPTQCLCTSNGIFTTTLGGDCNDDDKDVHPTAFEGCNSLDDNCNGITDADSPDVATWYFDADLDGYGTSASVIGCFASGKYTTKTSGDCDDGSAAVHPNATEICNTVDDNCNGITDDDAAAVQVYYFDSDGDTYGSTAFVTKCGPTGKYTASNNLDCDDANTAVHPGAAETCNGVDDNCDAVIDPQDAGGCKLFLKDVDQDSYGVASEVKCLCSAGLGHPDYTATKPGDCNDAKATINPSVAELCGDKIDNNCDGLTDTGVATTDCVNFYVDADSDGYGGAEVAPKCLCSAEGTFVVTQAGDCDDNAPAVNPAAFEACNSIDDNCNGITDSDSTDVKTWYFDGDFDGVGASASIVHCGPTGKYTASFSGDCNDLNAAVHPGAVEICNNIDDNCNGVTDDDSPAAHAFYFDGDADGFGTTASLTRCSATGKYTANNSTDCDDAKYLVHPGGTEACNGYDDNCDAVTDEENATGCKDFYLDVDKDNYGIVGNSKCLCSAGLYNSTYAAPVAGDCDDMNGTINPGAAEKCGDGIDNNCDSMTDDPGAVGCVVYYTDVDKDNYGVTSPPPECLCAKVGAFTAVKGGDCDDTAASIHPGVYELCNGKDDNCNSVTDDDSPDIKTWYYDADHDGYGTTAFVQKCFGFGLYTGAKTGDCNDSDATISPGIAEVCDNFVDDNCNGTTDLDAAGLTTWYLDVDKDGWGLPSFIQKCEPAAPYTATKLLDCNDGDAAIHPGAYEACDGIDNNCSGSIDTDSPDLKTYYYDGDGDGFGTSASTSSCGPTGKYTATNSTDCDDTHSGAHPGAAEGCDGYDNNCDGIVDEENAAYCVIYLLDADKDTYGVASQAKCLCSPGLYNPTFTASVGGDCNDSAAAVNPLAIEKCGDNIDNNCDSMIDNPGSSGCTLYYTDVDKDGYGVAYPAPQCLCAKTGDLQATATGDCDDTVATIHPNAAELCNSKDDNCNGTTDDDSPDVKIWYLDADGDSYGIASFVQKCFAAAPYTATNFSDCNDSIAAINPGMTEVCDNNVDDNCNAIIDLDAAGVKDWYLDADKDTYGVGLPIKACTAQGLFTANNATDCNDGNWGIHPGALESCDGVDNNCNSIVDDDSPYAVVWYYDADGDTYGSGASVTKCASTGLYNATQSGDCADSNAAIHPGVAEACDGLDNNCDGKTDDVAATSMCPYLPQATVTCIAGKCGGTCDAQWFNLNNNMADGCECPMDAAHGANATPPTAVDLGVLADTGQSVSPMGSIFPDEAGDWYVFYAKDNPEADIGGCDTFNVRVEFGSNTSSDFAIDLYRGGYAAANALCATGDNTAGWHTNFYSVPPAGEVHLDGKVGGDVYKSTQPNWAGECPCVNHVEGSTSPVDPQPVNYCSNNSAYFYIRVYRKTPATSCSATQYQLVVSNGY